MFVERHVRVIKQKTNLNGRDVLRIANADFATRQIHDRQLREGKIMRPIPTYARGHPTGYEAKWWKQKPIARDLSGIIWLITAENLGYGERDVRAVMDDIEFTSKMTYKGRQFTTRLSDLRLRRHSSNCVVLVNFGNDDDVGRASVAVIKGFYRVKIQDDVFVFASIRVVKLLPCASFPNVKRININQSDTVTAAQGELVQLSQLNVTATLVLLPQVTVLPGRGRDRASHSRSDAVYFVCLVYS